MGDRSMRLWLQPHGASDEAMNNDSARLATLMRTQREAAGLTQRQLASAGGVSLGALQDIEQGRTVQPRPGTVGALAAALQLSGSQREDLDSASTGTMPTGQAAFQSLLRRRAAGRERAGLRLQTLGALAAWRNGVPVALGPVRQRAVLGLLAIHCDTGLRRSAIIDALWGEDPPPTAVAMVQTYVSRARRLLGSPGRRPAMTG